jgi:hypothetical protein
MTGKGRYCTMLASFIFPRRMSITPSKAVYAESTTRVVGTILSGDLQPEAILLAIALRNIKPASWTCPTANVKPLNIVKHI